MGEIYAKLADQHLHKDGPWPLITQKVVSLIGKRVTDSPRVLDIATGPGQPGLMIAQTLPNSSVTCTDISADMIAICHANAQSLGLKNVSVCIADAQDLSQFPSNSFDVVTACYGYMFAENKKLALSETLRVLKPGGSLIATTWDALDLVPLCREVMTKVLGAEPPPLALDPMSLPQGLFNTLLVEAGFSAELIHTSASTYPFDLGADKDFQYKCGTLLVKQQLDELDAHVTAREAFFQSVGKYGSGGSGSLILPHNTFALTVASKSSEY